MQAKQIPAFKEHPHPGSHAHAHVDTNDCLLWYLLEWKQMTQAVGLQREKGTIYSYWEWRKVGRDQWNTPAKAKGRRVPGVVAM